ncbi:DMT family transporter [Deltaproteobacteria bacterium]|nr:DMT family transporter [Deltaproteobacteria bacterium]
MQLLLISLTFLMGIMIAMYLPMNSSVARYLGSSITASIPFFFMATVTTIALLFIFGDYKMVLKIKNLPGYLFLPGFLAAFMVLWTTFLIPKIGARNFFILIIAGQILMSMFLSHFGLLESPQDPITLKKLLGALLVLAGASLSTF